ncbi:MAG: ubiquinone/menaquinone biosynthesis methyltransferase [Acidimicrobiales bacterium]
MTSPVLPEGDEKVRAVRAMFDRIAPRYDLVNRVMTFGLDVGWRRRAVRSLALPRGALVFDLGCGTGDLCRELDDRGLRPVGFDLSLGMLAAARTPAPLVQADVLTLPVPDAAADGVTCGFTLRNLADLGAFFAELARIVRPGGRVALLEVGQPTSPLLRAGHRVYFGRVVPRIGGLLSDGAAYRYLPRSVAYLPPPADLVARLAGAGFADTERAPLTGGIAQLMTATRRPS